MASTHFKTWAAYQKAFSLAHNIFLVSQRFPREERYSLTDQIRRSSRSVCANLAESYAKRRYPKHFVAKVTDALGENCETQCWLDHAVDAKYITCNKHQELTSLAEEVSRILHWMENNPGHYLAPNRRS